MKSVGFQPNLPNPASSRLSRPKRVASQLAWPGVSIAAHLGTFLALTSTSVTTLAEYAGLVALPLATIGLLSKSFYSTHKALQQRVAASTEKIRQWLENQHQHLANWAKNILTAGQPPVENSIDWFKFFTQTETLRHEYSLEVHLDNRESLETMFNRQLSALQANTRKYTYPTEVFQHIYDHVQSHFRYLSGRARLESSLVPRAAIEALLGKNQRVWKHFFTNPQDQFLEFQSDFSARLTRALKNKEISKKKGARIKALFKESQVKQVGNCESKAKWCLALAQQLIDWPNNSWRLGLALYQDHIDVVLVSKETGEIYDPIARKITAEVDAPVYEPRLFAFAYLKGRGQIAPIFAHNLLLVRYNKPINHQGGEYSANNNSIFNFDVNSALPTFRGGGDTPAAVQAITETSLLQKISTLSTAAVAQILAIPRQRWFNKWVFIGVSLAFLAGYKVYQAVKELGFCQAACASFEKKNDGHTFFRHPEAHSWFFTQCPPTFGDALLRSRESRLREAIFAMKSKLDHKSSMLHENQYALSSIGQIGFSKVEFSSKLKIETLCQAIQQDNYGLSLKQPDNTIERLNELLENPDFYKAWQKKYQGKIQLPPETRELLNNFIKHVNSAEHHHHNKDSASLCYYTFGKVGKLNRLLLEATYADCPRWPYFSSDHFFIRQQLQTNFVSGINQLRDEIAYHHYSGSTDNWTGIRDFPLPENVDTWLFSRSYYNRAINFTVTTKDGIEKLAALPADKLDTFFQPLTKAERTMLYAQLETMAIERWRGQAHGFSKAEKRDGKDRLNQSGVNGKDQRDISGTTSQPVKNILVDLGPTEIKGDKKYRDQRDRPGYLKDIEENGESQGKLVPDQESGPGLSQTKKKSVDHSSANQNRSEKPALTYSDQENAQASDILWFDLSSPPSLPATNPASSPNRPALERSGQFAPRKLEEKQTLVVPSHLEFDQLAHLVIRIIDLATKHHPEDQRLLEGLQMRLLSLPGAKEALGQRFALWRNLLVEPSARVAPPGVIDFRDISDRFPDPMKVYFTLVKQGFIAPDGKVLKALDPSFIDQHIIKAKDYRSLKDVFDRANKLAEKIKADCQYDLPPDLPLRHLKQNTCLWTFSNLPLETSKLITIRGRFTSQEISDQFINELLELSAKQQASVMSRLTDKALVKLYYAARSLPADSPVRARLSQLVAAYTDPDSRLRKDERDLSFAAAKWSPNRFYSWIYAYNIFKSSFKDFGNNQDLIWQQLIDKGYIEPKYVSPPFRPTLDAAKLGLSPSESIQIQIALSEPPVDPYEIPGNDARRKQILAALISQGYLVEAGAPKITFNEIDLPPPIKRIFRQALNLEWGDPILQAIDSYDEYWHQQFANFEFRPDYLNNRLTEAKLIIASNFNFLPQEYKESLKSWPYTIDRLNSYVKNPELYDLWLKSGKEIAVPTETDQRIKELALATKEFRDRDFESLSNQKKLLIMKLNWHLINGILKTPLSKSK